MPERRASLRLRALVGTLLGSAGFAGVGAAIGYGIGAVGDPTAERSAPMLLCATLGFVAGGAFGANIALPQPGRSAPISPGIVVFLGLVIGMVAAAGLAEVTGVPVYAFLPVAPVIAALAAVEVTGRG